MKKVFKILLISIVAVLGALCLFACTTPAAPTGGLPDILDVDAGEYETPHNTAYGEVPDLDNVVIDGFIDDELWTADTMKWYTHYEATPRISYKMAATVSEGGLYIAFRSDDPIVAWHGYNYFYRNTNIRFFLYSSDHGGRDINFTLDANNIAPVDYFINARCQYYGDLNIAGKGDGISAEVYIKWEDLEIDTTNGAPQYMAILPVYRYISSPTASKTTDMYPTFVKTTGNRNQAIVFDKNGYIDGDDPDAIVGSHESGLAKTNGWTIEKDEDGVETAVSNKTATVGFAQLAFFRNSNSSRFKVTTRIKFGAGAIDSRAGIILYRDSINYRAIALQYDGRGKAEDAKYDAYSLRGYTNYPSNITSTTHIYDETADFSYNEAELTVYNNMGKLYYILNGEFVGSEMATYVATNNYIGLYAFDTTTTFSDYECISFRDEQELLDDFSEFAYVVNVYSSSPTHLTITTDQLAVSKENGSVNVTLTFTPGYTLASAGYSYDDSTEITSAMEYAEQAKHGVFNLPVDGNVTIHVGAEPIPEDELISLSLIALDADTETKIAGMDATVIGDGQFTRYTTRFDYRGATIKIPKGLKWQYVAGGMGYSETKGDILGGETIDADVTDPAPVYVKSLIIGGTAYPPVDENGNNVISFSKASVPGATFNLEKGEEGLVTFQTSATDAGEVYFSGRTISDYQVAYVEITNRTDPSAFTSLENDPAAGFLVAGENATSYIGLWQTGLRIIPVRTKFSERTDRSGLMKYSGYLPKVDRSNGGRFISASPGTGTINRIPYDGKEYTTSLLLIRKGGYNYIYAADGKAGVKSDRTNFSKLKLVYSFFNDVNKGYAAVGFGCTVAFNLRVDYENYWILCGDKAAAFADSYIATNLEVLGEKDKLSFSGNGIINYNENTGKGKIVKNSEINVRAKGLEDGKMLKVTASSGEVYYISDSSSIYTISNSSGNALSLRVEEVEYEVISGRVVTPEGLSKRVYSGTIYDMNGNRIMDVNTDRNGEFGARVAKGTKVKVAFRLDGYAMAPTPVTTGTVLEFVEIPVGGNVVREDSITGISSSYVQYGYNEEQGIYFDVNHNNPAEGYVYVKKDNTSENMIIDMDYNRLAVPGNASIDGDISFGAIFYGQSGSYAMRYIGDGYRIMLNDNYNTSTNIEARGFSSTNMKSATNSTAYNFRFIKLGSVVYMCSKLDTQDTYNVLVAFDLMPHVGSKLTSVALGWVSYGYANFRVSNLNVTELQDETAADLIGDMTLLDLYVTGDVDNAVLGGCGLISGNGTTYKVARNSAITVKAQDLADGELLKVSCGGTEEYLKNGEMTTVTAPKSGDMFMDISAIEAVTVSGNVVAPAGVSLTRFTGHVRNANGDIFTSITTDNKGKFSVFVDKNAEYYVHFYLDGYVSEARKIVPGEEIKDITFKKVDLVTTLSRMDGTTDNGISSTVEMYEKADGSLAFDLRGDNATSDYVYFKPEMVDENVVISFSYERRAMPAGAGGKEDGDASVGLVFFGKSGSYGARFIAQGCRIMVNDVYNDSLNLGGRTGSPVNMQNNPTPQPYDFKFVKAGSMLYMYAKLRAHNSYQLVYTLDLMGSHHSIGSVLSDIAISWCSYGWTDMTFSNIKIEPYTEANSEGLYRVVDVNADEGGEVLINGNAAEGTLVTAKGASINLTVTPAEGKKIASIIVAGTEVNLSAVGNGAYTGIVKLGSGDTIDVKFEDIA